MVSATLTLGLMMALIGASGASALVVEDTFKYTGAEQTFTVPAGVTSIHVVATGAVGGTASDGGTLGGRGAVVSGDLSVKPGPLYIEVGGPGGGAGGFNGGGSGGTGGFGQFLSGGGGGASDVREVPNGDANSLQSRLLVAAGGGGGGIFQEQSNPACPGGPGGDEEQPGSNGENCGQVGAFGGGAGKGTEGGAGGAEAPSGFVFHIQGTAGALGVGGTDAHAGETYEGNGGGGGGGLYGGGGGGGTALFEAGAGGGGGGSNLLPAGGMSAVAVLGVQPSVTITYDTPVTAGPGPALPNALLSQEIATTSAPPSNVVGTAVPVVPADVAIVGAGDTVAVHGKTALVSITCRSAAPCTGAVDLQSRAYGSSGQVVFARTRFTIGSRETAIVALALRKAGRQLLRHHKRAPAYLYLHPSGGLPAGTLYIGGKIQLTLRDTRRL
jgi:hypothetical protein